MCGKRGFELSEDNVEETLQLPRAGAGLNGITRQNVD